MKWSSLVKPEEAVIVGFVLIVWIGVIFLFIRKWGKIRGSEPYTPAFERTLASTLPVSKQVSVARRNSSLIHEFNMNIRRKSNPSLIHEFNMNIRRKSAAFIEENNRRLSTRINVENEHGESINCISAQSKPLLSTQSCATLTTK